MKFITFLIIVISLSLARYTYSQSISTKGTDFWLSYMDQWCNPPTLHVYITADELASGAISNPLTGWSQNFTVPANSTIDILVPSTDAFVTNSETIENKGVHISTDVDVTVYALNYCTVSSDATIVLPTPSLGREYYSLMYEGQKSYQISEFIIVGIHDNTEIEITPAALTVNNQPAGVPFTVTLDQGEVYLVKANNIDDATTTDLTGSHIIATGDECKTFAVFSGNKCAHVPPLVNWGDHLLEQMMPVKSWGKKYVTAPLKTRIGDLFRILASENGTAVSINGDAPVLLNAGEFHEILLDTASYIEADKPVSVAQFSRSCDADGVGNSDPFMVLVSPVEQTIEHIVFNSFTSSVITAYYLNLITTGANVDLVTLDGIPVDTSFSPVPSNPEYSFAQIDLTVGNHVVHSDSGVIAYVYGYGFHESYGYVAGASMENLAIQFDIVLGSDTVFYQSFTNSICEGTTLEFIAAENPNFTDWYWNFGDGSGIDTGMSVSHTYTDTGTFSVQLIVSDICGSDSVTWEINVTSGLQVIVSDDISVCAGDSIQLFASGAVSYTWSPSTGLSQATGSVVTAFPLSTTVYTVTGSDGSGCTGTDSITVSVVTPPVAEAGNDQAICIGDNITLTASGGANYIWNTSATTVSITVSPSTTTTYTVTVSDIMGCSDTDDVTVNVNSLPSLDLGSDVSFCAGNIVTLDAGSGFTAYSWSTAETGQTISVNASGAYYVTATDANGCSGSDGIIITVYPLPITNAGTDQSICYGSSATLTASGGTSYTWNTGATSQSITVTPLSTTTYTVTATTNGCSASDNVTVTVNPMPVPGISATLPVVCSGDSTQLTATGGTSYLWNNGATTQIVTVSPPVTTTYSVTVSNSGCSATTSMEIIVNDTISVIVSPSVICVGQSATITAAGGDVYQWSTGGSTQTITVSPLTTTVYSVTVTAGGCTGYADVTVTVNPLPTANAGSDQSICFGDSATLSAGGGTSYLWNTGTASSSITVSPVTTTTYVVTVTDNGCSGTDEVSVTVIPIPAVYAGPDITICEGDTDTLSASGGTVYQWSTGDTVQNIIVNPSVSTVYSVTVTENGCSAADSMNLTVNPLPAANAGADQVICEGSVTTLSAVGGDSYIWSNGQATQDILVAPLVSSTFTVTVSLAGCAATDEITIDVSPALTASIQATLSAVCSSDTTQLLASGGVSYLWSTGATAQNITVMPPVTTQYFVTVSDSYCSDSTDIIITVFPNVTATCSPSVICEGESAELAVSSGDSYLWSTGDTTQTIVVTPYTTTIYYVTVTDTLCEDAAQVQVTVVPLPVADAGDDQTICHGGSITLTATGGTTYYWSNASAGQSIIITPATTTVYTVTVVNTNGCSSTDEVVVFVNPSPTAWVGNDAVICEGESVKLNAGGGNTYLWSPAASLSSPTDQNPVATPPASTTYTVTVSNADGCTDTESITVTVLPGVISEISVSMIPATTVCVGENIMFMAGTVNGGTSPQFQWMVNSINVGSNQAGYSSSALCDNDYVICRLTSSEQCVLENPVADSVQVSISPKPVVSLGYSDNRGCQPLTVYFMGYGSDDVSTYSWSFVSENGSNYSSEEDPVVTFDEGVYDISLTVSSPYGCSSTMGYTNAITVYPLPVAQFWADPMVTGSFDPVITFTNSSSQNTIAGNWDFGDGKQAVNSLAEFDHTYDEAGVYTVQLVAVTNRGCMDTASLEIQISQDVTFYVPTAFTPMSTELNEANAYFYLKGSGINEESFRFYIFDRWGELIFQTSELFDPDNPNENARWNGKVNNSGRYVPVGTYTWMVVFTGLDNVKYERSGSVTVIR
ncbi:MAG: PKD domain-containing protein [Bacteroidetes bacterium]|nr:PKD domain-containing protein [Bacteroidota bacterium]